MPNKTALEIRLDRLQKATENFFQLDGRRERDHASRAELIALFIRIFNTLHDRLRNLDWKSDTAVSNALRPYLNGLPEERARYIEIIGNKLQDPADRWQRFIKQLQANLNGLREEKQTEVARCREELAAGNEIADQSKCGDEIGAVLHDLETWPVDDSAGNETKGRLVRALRGLLTSENVRALGCLRLTVLTATENQQIIARLRGELNAAESLLAEAAQTAPAAVPEGSMLVDELDGGDTAGLATTITERIEDLEIALELLQEELDEYEQNSLNLVSLIAVAEERLNKEADKRKLTSARNEHNRIETWAANVRGRIEQIRARQIATEQIITPLTQHKQRLVSELAALRTVLGCMKSEVGLHDVVSLPQWDEPDLETLLAEETKPRDQTQNLQEKKPAVTNTGQIEGLPFAVIFNETGVRLVREFETFLETFVGLEEAEIRRRLPYQPSKNYELYYDLFVSRLRRGDFLPALQMAFVVLNAARRDGRLTVRVSITISQLMLARNVRLSAFAGAAATEACQALSLAFVLGIIESRWHLLNRFHTGSKRGRGNELTPLGQIFANVWTSDLLASGRVSQEQIRGIVTTMAEMDKRRAAKKQESRQG